MDREEAVAEGTTRRQELADAAISTLARAGMRGLTHRAVDEAAGVPTGSCSYYFRTRQALLQATVERLAEVDTADLADHPVSAEPVDIAQVAAVTADLVERWVTTGRERMLARYELSLESTRRPELHAVLVAAGKAHRAVAQDLLTAAGTSDPPSQAPVLVAFLDGLVFDHLAGAGELRLTTDELRKRFFDLLYGFTRPLHP
ncbi:TetR/AcrR family transcriptional regulator [Streptomyces sp. FH025]|uniref:TetR/AcrR family transcriptional regulator n=1 Tax=Streptomyces sp. FH025 TaxID=2815937 RepID=UPI001A9DD4FE|nr:TetR/AcrR family transcriptional regulator [Streptomyces sp. FH025]MBO1414728.1 TetR family transcriptional regulator [Streptomyces sp. FH025]